MNNIDVIRTLGQNEGRKLKPNSFDVRLPYFNVSNSKVESISNFENHDNASRLVFLKEYLNKNIMPNIDKSIKLNGYFGIELHDSNSYLQNNIDYDNALVWARNRNDRKSILIPDLYHLANFNDDLSKYQDNYTFDTKPIHKIGFFGTTTGSRDPKLNQRIQTALWSLDKRDKIDCYITNIAQIEPELLKKTIINFKDVLHPYMETSCLFRYKYLLDIMGNTYSWNRVPIILNSKSLLFKMPCDDLGWYYPLLHDLTHFVGVSHDNMITKMNYYENNQKEASFMIDNANKFVSDYLRNIHAVVYLVSMFEESHYWHAR